MLHTDAKNLRERGDRLFSKKSSLDSRNQQIATHFYAERADFTSSFELGDEYVSNLTTSYPLMVRRSLGDAIGSMLRPRSKQWFSMRTQRWEKVDHEGRRWCEWATQVQRRAIYDRVTQFMRATKEGDHDFAAFGGCVISIEVSRRNMALLFRNWHLRDVAWAEDETGAIGERHRNWKPTCEQLVKLFRGKVHPEVSKACERNEGDREIRVRHAVIRADEYDHKSFRTPWVSVYLDCENEHVMEEVGAWTPVYVIPRWATVSGSQYPYSPAAVIALPDARLLQAQALTMLEAGEKAVNPPMVGVGEAITNGLNIMAGGFTSVAAEYDERLGEVLRPLTQDHRFLQVGVEMMDRTAAMLREAFFLNTLSMPPAGTAPEMTAFEVGQRVSEYIRNALPIFEPMEHEYNAAICDDSFELLLRNGAFGPPQDMPQSIRGQETQYVFDSPLAEMIEREKGTRFQEAQAMVAASAQVDPSSLMIIDFGMALRDTLTGIGVPTKWMRSPEEVQAAQDKQAADQAAATALAGMQQGAEVADSLGSAAKSFADARAA